MTLFINVDNAASLFGKMGIGNAIQQMALYIKADYCRWADFDKSPRTANHSESGVIELMPTDDGKQYSFKYVNGHPANAIRNLPTVMAFGVLADVQSGYPTFLSELTLTTAVRTAATSALVAQSLARKNSTCMALIGNGAQSEFQAIAFHEMLGINEVRIFDIDHAASLKLKRNLEAYTGITVTVATSVHEAVKGADIITTVTADKAYATILTPDMIEPGMHINAVGGDCPGKPNFMPISCATPGSSSSSSPRHASKATFSNWPQTFRSSNSSASSGTTNPAAKVTLKSQCSILLALPSKTFLRFVTYMTWLASMAWAKRSIWCPPRKTSRTCIS